MAGPADGPTVERARLPLRTATWVPAGAPHPTSAYWPEWAPVRRSRNGTSSERSRPPAARVLSPEMRRRTAGFSFGDAPQARATERFARNGHGNGFAKRCAHGERAKALRRPRTTGRAPTHADAAAKRSNDYEPDNGPRRPLSSICTAAGQRPSPTPSPAPCTLVPLLLNAADTRTRARAWPPVNGTPPKVAATARRSVPRGRAPPRARGHLSAAARFVLRGHSSAVRSLRPRRTRSAATIAAVAKLQAGLDLLHARTSDRQLSAGASRGHGSCRAFRTHADPRVAGRTPTATR